jgi:hypothetical protein
MKILKVVLGVFLIFCILFTFIFGKNLIDKDKELVEKTDYKGIINLWHIDTFEGGTGSRKQFLLKVSREYEKERKGVLVFATNHTINSVKENFSKGIYPDIISFGNGVEVNNLIELSFDKKFDSGIFNEKQLIIPWCRGGYFLIKNNEYKRKKGEKKTLLVSSSEYNLPLATLLDREKDFSIKIKSQYNAYLDFVSGGSEYLLGTQRDIVRLTNRAFPFFAEPLSTFNDLYQYVSVIKTTEEKVDESLKFVEFLLSKKVQEKLNEIDMFSCFYPVSFESEYMASMQKLNSFNTISPFNKSEFMLELKDASIKAYMGDEDNFNKLKKFII